MEKAELHHKKKTVYTRLIGEIDFNSIKEPMRAIDEAKEREDVENIILTITSVGGWFYPSFALYDQIKASSKPVDIIASGCCMSAALMILQAARERISHPHTIFMIHPSNFKSIHNQPYEEILENVEQYKRNHEVFIELTIKRAGISRKEFEKLYSPVLYLTSQEAKKFGTNGLIDTINSY